jgi:hypothetical protein
MKAYQLHKSFVYRHVSGDLPLMIQQCRHFLNTHSNRRLVSDAFFAKIQWTITELLLNGTKHSGVAESKLNIELHENGIAVVKEDAGNPLKLKVLESKLVWPIPTDHVGQRFEVYQNGMDSLRIRTVSRDKVEFYVTELDDIQMPGLLSSTSEHFGLMIIAKASDVFSYCYDQRTGSNIFSTIFNFE